MTESPVISGLNGHELPDRSAVHVIVEWHWQVIYAKIETLIVTSYKYV